MRVVDRRNGYFLSLMLYSAVMVPALNFDAARVPVDLVKFRHWSVMFVIFIP